MKEQKDITNRHPAMVEGGIVSMVTGNTVDSERYRDHRRRIDTRLHELITNSRNSTILQREYSKYRNKQNKGLPLGKEAAHFVSAIDAMTLAVDIPGLYSVFSEFMPARRVIDYLELTGSLEMRGGKTMFMGSGRTMHEVMAWFCAIPDQSKVEEVVSTDLARLDQVLSLSFHENYQPFERMKILQMAGYNPVPTISGSATSVDPMISSEEIVSVFSQIYLPHFDHTHHVRTLRDHISLEPPSGQYDNLLIQRADPYVYSHVEPDGSIVFDESFYNMLRYVHDEGQVIISIGRGNNYEELSLRKNFLNQMARSVRQIGFSCKHIRLGININPNAKVENESIPNLAFGMEDHILEVAILKKGSRKK